MLNKFILKNSFRLNISKALAFIFIFFAILPAILAPNAASAFSIWGDPTTATQVQEKSGLPEGDIRIFIASLIRPVLGMLGIIAVIIILIGGFKYMTAGGAEDKVTEARKIMVNGIIGLIIIVMAFGIATIVIGAIEKAS